MHGIFHIYVIKNGEFLYLFGNKDEDDVDKASKRRRGEQ
jgi:ribosome biogenesis protein Nip4